MSYIIAPGMEIFESAHHADQTVVLAKLKKPEMESWSDWMKKYYTEEVIAEILETVRLRKKGVVIHISPIGAPDDICKVCLSTVLHPPCGSATGGDYDKDMQALAKQGWLVDQTV